MMLDSGQNCMKILLPYLKTNEKIINNHFKHMKVNYFVEFKYKQ